MRILCALIGLMLTFGQAYTAPLNLERIRTNVELTGYEPGTIVVSTRERRLFYKTQEGDVLAFDVSVGREGFSWSGSASVSQMRVWPDWFPPAEMRKRQPELPKRMAGGLGNPLGARALYLAQGNKETEFRIHGSNSADAVGYAVSSGCIRMHNEDVMMLYKLVNVGTKVVVLK